MNSDNVKTILSGFFTRPEEAKFTPTVHWINVASSTRRREIMLQQFSDLVIPNRRFEAVTPETIPEGQLVGGKDTSKMNRHQLCVLGCYLSHLGAVCVASESKKHCADPFFITVEDDTVFNRRINFEAVVASAPKDWEILQLVCGRGTIVRKMFRRDLLRKGHVWKSWERSHWGTGAVIWRDSAAQTIRSWKSDSFQPCLDLASRRKPRPIDQSIYTKFKSYTLTLPLFTFEGADSDIQPSLTSQRFACREVRKIQTTNFFKSLFSPA